jgi:hypothetical protein
MKERPQIGWVITDEPEKGKGRSAIRYEPKNHLFRKSHIESGTNIKIEFKGLGRFDIKDGEKIIPIFIKSAEGIFCIDSSRQPRLIQVTVKRKSVDGTEMSLELESLPFNVFYGDKLFKQAANGKWKKI